MSSENLKKSSTMDKLKKSASGTDVGKDRDTAELAAQASEIKLNEFLDLLKMSCHINEMITNGVPPQHSVSASNIAGSRMSGGDDKPESATAVDFQKLVDNRLVNELFGHKKEKPKDITPITEDIVDTAHNTGCNSERSRPRRRSTFGTTAAIYFTRNAGAKQPDIATPDGLHPKLDEKLDYVINEGVLDSVLPFICPVPLPMKFTARPKPKPKEPNLTVQTTAQHIMAVSVGGGDVACISTGAGDGETAAFKTKGVLRKTLLNTKSSTNSPNNKKKEPEVVIHVCDEVKNTSRDFACPQSLLVSKMGYFADVTAGQRLEDMDISVHCDIQIFDWLMKWVKYSTNQMPHSTEAAAPQLDGSNVVPILVSASFLQMEPLLLDCLTFCHANLNDVVRSSTNLSCLNDSIVTRLAAMFTNLELEAVRDKKERLTPRLWGKLIQSLCEPEPEALRGHYYSLSGLFRCAKCGKCLTNSSKSYVSCLANNLRLNRWGQLVSYHVRDSAWDINCYIMQLFKDLKSWRKVYWKLWGHCHVLYCCICETHFQAYQMTWCRFHPENPNYLGPLTEGRLAGPAGRYPCCGQQAFRFETLPGPNGCQFREHSVMVETDRERAILSIVQLVSEACALYEHPPLKLHEIIVSGDLEPRWLGLPLTPQRCRQGLLPALNPEHLAKIGRRLRQTHQHLEESSSESDTSDTEECRDSRRCVRGATHSEYSSSSDGCESDYRRPKNTHTKKAKKRTTDISGRYWCGETSARSNQDNQREFEEKVMKQVVALVNKKTGSDQSLAQSVAPIGGAYVRLEAEWKDQLKQRHNNSNNSSSCNPSSSNTNLVMARTKQNK